MADEYDAQNVRNGTVGEVRRDPSNDKDGRRYGKTNLDAVSCYVQAEIG